MVHSIKTLLSVLFLLMFLFGCSNSSTIKESKVVETNIINGYYYHNLDTIKYDTSLKKINTGPYKLIAPKSWEFKKLQGIDSYVGQLKKDTISFHFEYSTQGYSNNLTDDTLKHLIKTDTIPPFYVKIVTPKIGSTGLTGIYFHHLESSLSLNFYTTDSLDTKTQKEAMDIINSITLIVK